MKKEKLCFYCDKKKVDWDLKSIEWMLNSTHICEPCRKIIEFKYQVSATTREPGEEG